MLRGQVWLVAMILAGSAGVAWADPAFTAAVVRHSGAAISEAFGPRDNAFHVGADIAAPPGAAVHAPAEGQVTRVLAPGELQGYHGQVVEIDHGGLGKTRFSNLEGVLIQAGERIAAGDEIGRIAVEANLPHVHEELWRASRIIDPATEITLISPP
jgi:murein DD-endopeptidase MepM/ murein hydrolase activator NlpD